MDNVHEQSFHHCEKLASTELLLRLRLRLLPPRRCAACAAPGCTPSSTVLLHFSECKAVHPATVAAA